MIDNAQQERPAEIQRRGPRYTAVLRSRLQQGLLVAFALVIVVFWALQPGTFGTLSNFQTIFSSQAVILALAIGLMIPLIAGELDLSLASVLGLSNVLIGWLNATHGWPIWLAVVVAILTGAAIGLVNGLLVVKLHLSSIVVTLGMGTLLAWHSASRAPRSPESRPRSSPLSDFKFSDSNRRSISPCSPQSSSGTSLPTRQSVAICISSA